MIQCTNMSEAATYDNMAASVGPASVDVAVCAGECEDIPMHGMVETNKTGENAVTDECARCRGTRTLLVTAGLFALLLVLVVLALYFGMRQADVNECASNPCPSDAVCLHIDNGYGCYINSCSEGYSGANCDILMPEMTNETPSTATTDVLLTATTQTPATSTTQAPTTVSFTTTIHVADAVDCNTYYELGVMTDGVYNIAPNGSEPFTAFCEFSGDTAWTYIQYRFDGSVNFTRTWADYMSGFGPLNGEHWLGNSRIHLLTSQADYVLRVDGTTEDGAHVWAVYDRFDISDEASLFRLNLGSLTAADPGTKAWSVLGGFLDYNRDMEFSALDRDNGMSSNCAVHHSGGWWHRGCGSTRLNSPYGTKSCSGTLCMVWSYPSTYVVQTTIKITRM